jgi:hypothetical protein
MANVRAKFRCIEKTQRTSTSNYGEAKPVDSEEVRFLPVAGPGNEAWSKWTPGGEIRMSINNPSAVAAFEVGKDYFVDFTAAE